MTSDKTELKARVYLSEGKVRAKHIDAVERMASFEISGSDATSEPYRVRYIEGTWRCDCPARVTRCAHIIAGELVTGFEDVPASERPAVQWKRDPELDDLLGDL